MKEKVRIRYLQVGLWAGARHFHVIESQKRRNVR